MIHLSICPFIHFFIHVFFKYLLSADYASGSAADAENTVMNKT